MSRLKILFGLGFSLAGILAATMLMAAAAETRVADAAMAGDMNAVRALIKQAVDVNAAQGDGMTALHWASLNGEPELAKVLLYAGANVKATTRLGGYTPLFMAAKAGSTAVVEALLKAGADPKFASSNGVTPLMMAATSGDAASIKLLAAAGADPNATERERGQTALGYAAAFNRPDAVRALLQHGAKPDLASKTIQPMAAQRGGDSGGGQGRGQTPAVPGAPPQGARGAGGGSRGAAPAEQAAERQNNNQNNGEEGGRGGGNPKGALTPLMYAARQGSYEAAKALLDGGATVDALNGDKSTALLLAIINGKFDLAKMLVLANADVTLASMDGATPLYGVVNTQWARKSFQPQPTPRYEKTTYIEMMTLLLDRGADPNARLTKELWYSEYNRDLQSASAAGATAFWKCADVGDIEGMRLLISRGADPNIGTLDGVTPLLIAAGAGVHGNDDVTAPAGRLPAVRYLVEELGADVNTADIAGGPRLEGFTRVESLQVATVPAPAGAATQQADRGGRAGGGYTALHNAAARGDNEMILYLVSKGAKVNAVSRSGVTIADMANGPRQRIQPYPETVALLEMLGSKNSHKCVSC